VCFLKSNPSRFRFILVEQSRKKTERNKKISEKKEKKKERKEKKGKKRKEEEKKGSYLLLFLLFLRYCDFICAQARVSSTV
jgi:hypothetical protein